ncbi:succinylglutamate desuccinylase [Rhizobium vallis]|uniref:Succinylglutamate desuccinylase n=1 Tax=Rhizobium vallis TaxID=634290 RepID=A0A432PC11_9HYPH|nr:succinylglutamate desuccinylase/aspartoacylase family protein [Rhizobium vallis]RUM20413.1 succinylglutamate desuccinylase [Rhizobium vallis]
MPEQLPEQDGSITHGIRRRLLRFSNPKLSDYVWPLCEIRGSQPGPRLCISAGVHVNEVSAIEAAVRLQRLFDPQEMRGSVEIIPLINQPARFQYSEYVCPIDGRNINFSFPGKPDGSFTEALCDAVTTEWTRGAACYVDLHGGDLREQVAFFSIYQRTGDENFDAEARALAMCFDAEIVVGLPPKHMEQPGRPPTGFARERRFSIMSEAGSHGMVEHDAVEYHVGGVLNIARHIGVLPEARSQFARGRAPCDDYIWVDSPEDGEFHALVDPGCQVTKGQQLGTIYSLFGEPLAPVVAPVDGLMLWRMTHPTLKAGMATLAIAVEERQ